MERHLMPTSDWFRNLIPRVPQMAVSPIRIDFYQVSFLYSNRSAFFNALFSIIQTENEYHLEADFTGLKREDVKVALDEEHNIFTVECIKDHAIPEEKVKKGEVNYHRQERSVCRSSR